MTRNISSKYEVKPLVFIGWTKDMGYMKMDICTLHADTEQVLYPV